MNNNILIFISGIFIVLIFNLIKTKNNEQFISGGGTTPIGSPCNKASMCVSKYCLTSSTGKRCAVLPVGQQCTLHTDCGSRNCKWDNLNKRNMCTANSLNNYCTYTNDCTLGNLGKCINNVCK